MAGYREHISVSGLLGLAYAFAAIFLFGFTAVQATVAAIFTWIAGMLPDLDSETGRPVQEMSGLTAAIVPVVLFQHSMSMGISADRATLASLLTYAAVRYGGPEILGRLAVHRGMFHSIPALLIAVNITFLGYYSEELRVRLLMAVGVGIGFLSHLVLDEIYSVQWNGVRVRLKKSSGTALKFFGKDQVINGLVVGVLMFLSYASLKSAGLIVDPNEKVAPEMIQITSELDDAPAYRMADEPKGTSFQ